MYLVSFFRNQPNSSSISSSRRKIQSLFAKLKERGVTQEALDFVHTPIGLDLGGETPQELAVGILAQLLLVKNGKDSRVRL